LTRYRDDLRQVSTYLDLADPEQAALFAWLDDDGARGRAGRIRGILLRARLDHLMEQALDRHVCSSQPRLHNGKPPVSPCCDGPVIPHTYKVGLTECQLSPLALDRMAQIRLPTRSSFDGA
jgi:hypothetical protein